MAHLPSYGVDLCSHQASAGPLLETITCIGPFFRVWLHAAAINKLTLQLQTKLGLMLYPHDPLLTQGGRIALVCLCDSARASSFHCILCSSTGVHCYQWDSGIMLDVLEAIQDGSMEVQRSNLLLCQAREFSPVILTCDNDMSAQSTWCNNQWQTVCFCADGHSQPGCLPTRTLKLNQKNTGAHKSAGTTGRLCCD